MPDDDAELVKAGVQGVVEGSLKPFSDLIAALFGPAASEAGLMLQDHVKYFRQKRQARLFKKTSEFLHDAGVTPQHVPLKLLAPILEAASLEEDDELQDIWARLLASAADPTANSTEAIPSYLSVLRELSSGDVKFLNDWYDMLTRLHPIDFIPSRAAITDHRFTISELLPTYHNVVPVIDQGVGDSHIDITVENLAAMLAVFVRHSLVAKIVYDDSIIHSQPLSASVGNDPTSYVFTDFGVMFVAACRGSKTVS